MRFSSPSPVKNPRASFPGHVTGFTLVELLVVISIVVILAALIFPLMSYARSTSQSASCASKLRQIGTAVSLYRGENGGSTPNCWGNWITGGSARGYWYNSLLGNIDPTYESGNPWSFKDGAAGANYLQTRDLLVCPATIKSGGFGSWGLGTMKSKLGYGMTALPVSNPKIYSTGNSDAPCNANESLPNRFFTMDLKRPESWPMIMDADAGGVFNLDNPIASRGSSDRFAARHNGRANVLMTDGHVETITYGDTRWARTELNDGTYY